MEGDHATVSERIAPQTSTIINDLPVRYRGEYARLPEYASPLHSPKEDDATMSDQSRLAMSAHPKAHRVTSSASSEVAFPVRDPLMPSFPTVILPAMFLNLATGEYIDVGFIHKLRQTHLVYCEDLNSMPFLRSRANIPFKHAKVKTMVDNIPLIFGDTARATIPAQLDIYLYQYNKAKTFWAVKIGAEYVIVKGGGTFWKPWLGPGEEFHHLGMAHAIGVDGGEAYESFKKKKKQRKEAKKARAVLDAANKAGTSQADTEPEKDIEAQSGSGIVTFDGAAGQDDKGEMKLIEAGCQDHIGAMDIDEVEGPDDSGTMEADETQAKEHFEALDVQGTQTQVKSLAMTSEETPVVETEKAETAIVKKYGRKATSKSGEPAGLAKLDLGLGKQEVCEKNSMTGTTFKVDPGNPNAI